MDTEKKHEKKKNFLDMTITELEDCFIGMGEKKYRALQVYRWIVRGVRNPMEMSDLSMELRKKLSDIFRTLEGPLIAVECLSHPEFCPRCADCVTRKIWSKIQNTMVDLLESLTLQDLVDMSEGKKVID